MIDAELVPAGSGPRTIAVTGTALRDRIAGAWLLAQKRARTEQAYRRDITAYFRWCDEFDIDPLHARRMHVDGYRRYLEHDRRLAASSVARNLAAVSSYYRHALAEFEDLVARNPLANVKRPEVPVESQTRHLSLDEVGRLVAAADDDGPLAGALVRMLLGTAVRVTELCAARTSDLRSDDDGRSLTVIRKGGRRARVAVPVDAANALDRYLTGRTGPLFLLRGQPITRRQVDYRLGRLARVAGIPGRVSPHVLRHTAATIAKRDGADVHNLQQMLGHRRIETTMRYVHASDDLRQSPAHAVGRLVEEAARISGGAAR